RAPQRAQAHSGNARCVREGGAHRRGARRPRRGAWSAPSRNLPRAHQALRRSPARRPRYARARGCARGRAARRDRDRRGAARSARRVGGGRSQRVAASGARASFGQGGGRRNRRRHRRAPPRDLSARTRTRQGARPWPMSARAQARSKFRASSARSRFAPGFQPRAGRRRFSSPKAFASWRGAGRARSAKSTSSPAAEVCWCSSRSRPENDWTTPHGRSPIASACASPPPPRRGWRDTPMIASAISVSMPCWWRRAVFRVISPRLSTPAADAVECQLAVSKHVLGASMRLNIAVQMDPIERISIRGHSTCALLLEARERGHAIPYYTPDRLVLRGAKVLANVQPLKVRDQQGEHFTLGETRRTELTEFDVVLLRQDPPFDLAYITTTHLLERIHPATLVVNDPAAVRNAPEKMFVMEFPDLMPPTLITRDLAEIKAFRAEHGDIVMKPLYGKGGEAVFRLAKEDLNFGSLYDLFAVTFREQWVVQKFLPAVKDRDKRVILVDGEFAGAVNRVPAPDDLRSNMVRGGIPKETELTARERDICERIGPALRERGLLFVGIDVIDGYLTEINVTSPTGI